MTGPSEDEQRAGDEDRSVKGELETTFGSELHLGFSKFRHVVHLVVQDVDHESEETGDVEGEERQGRLEEVEATFSARGTSQESVGMFGQSSLRGVKNVLGKDDREGLEPKVEDGYKEEGLDEVSAIIVKVVNMAYMRTVDDSNVDVCEEYGRLSEELESTENGLGPSGSDSGTILRVKFFLGHDEVVAGELSKAASSLVENVGSVGLGLEEGLEGVESANRILGDSGS